MFQSVSKHSICCALFTVLGADHSFLFCAFNLFQFLKALILTSFYPHCFTPFCLFQSLSIHSISLNPFSVLGAVHTSPVLGFGVFGFPMAVDAIPCGEDFRNSHPRGATRHPPSFFLRNLSALFKAIDSECRMQEMGSQPEAREGDEVIYYVNRDTSGWVQQHVRRRVYIELKLECTRNRTRNHNKARDDWLCVYCKGSFLSKLRLTDHRLGGCAHGPVNSNGVKWDLPVYPNLKTAKQGKDLKHSLQRGEGEVWDNLSDEDVWYELNPELRDITTPPAGARVVERRFMEATLENLRACPPRTPDSRPPPRFKPPLPRRQQSAPHEPEVVDIPEDDSEPEAPLPRPSKRRHAEAGEDAGPSARPSKRRHAETPDGHRVQHSPRQWNAPPRKQAPVHQRQTSGSDQAAPNHSRSSHPPPGGHRVPPPLPIRVTPIQTRSPSPERAAILAPIPPAHVPAAVAPVPPVTPAIPTESPGGSQDMAAELRNERQAFYLKAASAARASVQMETPKPPLRTPIQPPALFYLMSCGLLAFDLEGGRYEDFEVEVQQWKGDPTFMDRLFAAFGRFCNPKHQVHCICHTLQLYEPCVPRS
jgi:hypothetical protein